MTDECRPAFVTQLAIAQAEIERLREAVKQTPSMRAQLMQAKASAHAECEFSGHKRIDDLNIEIARLRAENAALHKQWSFQATERDTAQTKLTALRMAVECLVEGIEHIVGTAALADMMFAIEASR